MQRPFVRRQVRQRFADKRDNTHYLQGVIGDGEGNIETGVENKIWCRVGNQVVRAWAFDIPKVYGLSVYIVNSSKYPGDLEVESGNATVNALVNAYQNNVASHGREHSWLGRDPVFVDKRQWLPLWIGPSGEAGRPFHIRIGGGLVRVGERLFAVPTQLIDLAALVPDGDALDNRWCRWVLVTVSNLGAVVVTAGAVVAEAAFDARSLPAAPDNTAVVVGAVRLYSDQVAITEARDRTDIVDLRLTEPADPTRANGDIIYRTAAAGGTNLATAAAGATVTAISVWAGYVAANAIDGNDTTFWAGASNPVADDWIYIDLGAVKTIGGYRLYQFPYGGDWGASRVRVQVTTELALEWQTVDEFYPAADDVTRDLSRAYSARYVRFYAVTGGVNSWQIYTIEIYQAAQAALTRLPIGASGQVLTVAGGVPVWAAAGGHDPVTVADTPTIDLTLTGQQLSADIKPGGIDAADLASGLALAGLSLKSDGSGGAAWLTEHAKVTMSAAADVILSIGDASQQITVDSQAANRVLAGPASGANAVPTFRALVEADIPAAVSARAVRSSALSVATSTWTSVPFASASWDNRPSGLSAQWESANPTRLTCRLAGLYYIHGAAVFALHATGQRLIKLLKNGTEFYQDFRMPMAVFGTPIILSTLLYLAVDDYIEMQAWQNSGGNLDLSWATPVPQLTFARLGW